MREREREREAIAREVDGGKVGPFIKHSVGFRHKFLPAVEIERESNRGKLETFRAIKSDLIFNKFTFHGTERAGSRTWFDAGDGAGNRRKGNLLGNYKVTSSGDAHSCEYSNAITSMIA